MTHAEIVIHDDHLTAWMPMSNWFSNGVNGWDPNDIHWKGVLIQLGTYVSTPSADFSVMLYEDPDGPPVRELALGDFQRWVDVMAVNAGGQPNHVRKPSAPGNVAAAMTNDLACLLVKGLTGCPPTTNPSCREKSLHFDFYPQRILTYWPGPNGYEISAHTDPGQPRHMMYTFALKDKVRIQIDGADFMTPGAIKKIVIDHIGNPSAHKDTQDPPWPVP